jgi:hypothetical protein
MTSQRAYYLDSSAYLCILLGESGNKELTKELKGCQLLSSVLLVLESTRTLIRLAREKILSPQDLHASLVRLEADTKQFLLRDLTLDLCSDRTLPVVLTPKSLDLAHLRTALWFHGRQPLNRFVSFDSLQKQAAQELGLPV